MVVPEGRDVWIGNHDGFQVETAISNKDNCISRLHYNWGGATQHLTCSTFSRRVCVVEEEEES